MKLMKCGCFGLIATVILVVPIVAQEAETEEYRSSILRLLVPIIATAPEIVTAPENILLRAVRVTPEWMPFDGVGGWPGAVPTKVSPALRVYEAAIWDEISSIHLYEFPNSFDWVYGQRPGITSQQVIDYREQYAIQKVSGMPEDSDSKSTFIRQAFESFAQYLVNRHPDAGHHLVYSGHGAAGGRLFEYLVYEPDANALLKYWSEQLGRKLGVVDMGGPCNKAGFLDLDNFCQYTQFYVAADIPNGGYEFDDWTIEKHAESKPDYQYHRLFTQHSDLQDVLIERIDLKRIAYEYSRNNMIENQTSQANYLYSCQKFLEFSPKLSSFMLDDIGVAYGIDNSVLPQSFEYDDVYHYLSNQPGTESLLNELSEVIIHHVDNRDFFPWTIERNGMSLDSRSN